MPCSSLAGLVDHARRAAAHAYAPYSRFAVGAAVLTAGGEIFTGCNVENASYGLTVCAERIALFNAVSQGHRSFRAIAVVGGEETPAMPCGACLQVLSEFCPPDTPILAAALPVDSTVRELSLQSCLPHGFTWPAAP